MFDLKQIEDHYDDYLKSWVSRSPDLEGVVRPIPHLLERRKILIRSHEELLAKRNEATRVIAEKKKQGDDASSEIAEQKTLGQKIKEADQELRQFQDDFQSTIQGLPNIPHQDVPVGTSEDDNKEVGRYGDPRSFDFEPLSHEVLGERRGWFRFEKAVEISGARFSISVGGAARLERALVQFMLDVHTTKNSYVEVIPPYIVNDKTLFGTGNLPKFEDDLFKLQGESPYYLIPTAEVPLTNLHARENLERSDLPKYYTAFTPCFRSEAGSYGKDLKGLIRQHQFHKVELVKIVHPDTSYEEHDKMKEDAQKILESLDLPYRTLLLCTGDMGFASAKTYDLEVWLPSQKKYREISSISNCTDFQARRMNTRFRDQDGKLKFVHTLNGSGLAVGRTLIAILENYQDKEGGVIIPPALRPYMGGVEKI